jgi:hypothetical protein
MNDLLEKLMHPGMAAWLLPDGYLEVITDYYQVGAHEIDAHYKITGKRETSHYKADPENFYKLLKERGYIRYFESETELSVGVEGEVTQEQIKYLRNKIEDTGKSFYYDIDSGTRAGVGGSDFSFFVKYLREHNRIR